MIIAEHDDQSQDDIIPPPKVRRNLSNEERWAIFSALLEKSDNGDLKKTHTREVADLFSVHRKMVQNIWRRAKETANNEHSIRNFKICFN